MAEKTEKCECGCEEEHDDVIMLEDENGKEMAFHYITTMEYEGKEYVFLQAAEGEDDEEDYLEIYELESGEDNGEEFDNLYPVEDDVYEILYNKLMKEIEEGECDDEDCDCHHHHED